MNKILKRIITIAVIFAVLGSAVLFFALSGKITAETKDGKLYLNAYYIGGTAAASAVTRSLDLYDIEFAENFDGKGENVNLYVSIPILEAGRCKSNKFKAFDETEEYMLFKYKSNKSVIILSAQHSVFVINAKNRDKTWDLYQSLLSEKERLLSQQ